MGNQLVGSKPIRTYTPERVRVRGKDMAVPQEMTIDEFMAFAWPEGQRWELIWGTPVMSPSPQPPHQDLVGDFYILFRRIFDNDPRYRVFFCVDVLLPKAGSYLCPDVSVFEDDGETDFERAPIRAVPKLVVEGLSPSTRGNDQGAKLEAYAAASVSEYWIGNPTTGGLTILTGPSGVGFNTEIMVDEHGFFRSPLLNLAVRVHKVGSRLRVETRP